MIIEIVCIDVVPPNFFQGNWCGKVSEFLVDALMVYVPTQSKPIFYGSLLRVVWKKHQ